MPVDERRRLQLADAAKRAFGDDEGITLKELPPPVGWADVATKQDLRELEATMTAAFQRGHRQILVVVSSLPVAGFLGTIVTSVTR